MLVVIRHLLLCTDKFCVCWLCAIHHPDLIGLTLYNSIPSCVNHNFVCFLTFILVCLQISNALSSLEFVDYFSKRLYFNRNCTVWLKHTPFPLRWKDKERASFKYTEQFNSLQLKWYRLDCWTIFKVKYQKFLLK